MKSSKRAMRQSLFTLLCFVCAATLLACGGKATKSDEAAEEIRRTQAQQAAEETGLQEEALMAFQLALAEIEKDPSDVEAAIGHLEKAVQLEPDFAEAHYNLGLLYGQTERRTESVRHVQRARELDPDVFDYTVALAQALAVNEQFADAETLFSEVLARDEQNLTAKNNMAVIALKRDDDERAMEFVREILREDIKNVGALNTLGLIYFKRGNLSLSKYVLEKALRVEEKNSDVLNNLGLVYMKEENVPAAVNAFRRAITANDDYLESRLNLGSILIEYLDYERADEQFTEAIRIAPHHCVANLGKGATSYATGEHGKAENHYKYYVDRCDAKHLSSYERLAKLNESFLDNPSEAIAYYKKLVELNPNTDKQKEYGAMIGFLESQLKSNTQQKPPVAEEGGTPE
ncbi:MAG: tetratricopeptide repeat protein [Bradymonadaceae bacterium]|nr:tetratricopeptide repeat protein [Lujinxingiaceae bacterium]